MLRKFREAQEEEGFTLIELLVVVIIIGILAAIAIPVFLNQRKKAWDSAAKSDLRNAATAQESYFTEESKYTTTTAHLATEGYNQSSDVTFTVKAVDPTTGNSTSYCMAAKHDNSSNWFYLDSDAGEPVLAADYTNGDGAAC